MTVKIILADSKWSCIIYINENICYPPFIIHVISSISRRSISYILTINTGDRTEAWRPSVTSTTSQTWGCIAGRLHSHRCPRCSPDRSTLLQCWKISDMSFPCHTRQNHTTLWHEKSVLNDIPACIAILLWQTQSKRVTCTVFENE